MSTPYTYRQSEPGLWTVGHYDSDGKWVAESDHEDREKAAARVHYLRGGTAPRPEPKPKREPAADGGPAYPQPYGSMDGSEGEWHVRPGDEGMSLRDHFAGVALGGMIAGRIPPAAKNSGLNALGVMVIDPDELAFNCWVIADAMLRQRDKAPAAAETEGGGL